MLLFSIPVIIWAPQLIAFFRNDPQVIQIGAVGLRVQGAVFVLHGVITCTIMLLQAIGKPIRASILACARQGLFFIPLIYLLPLKFGNAAVLYIQPIADALTFFFSILFVFYALKHLKAKKQPAEMPNRLSPQKLF